jgi:predicted phosphodiesterase
MSTIAVLADIHGNLPALQAVIEDMERSPVDAVVVAGDLINWGPFSLEVLELVTDEGWAVIRGNHEYYLLDYGTPRAKAEWHDTSQYPQLPVLRQQLEGHWHSVIATWPDTLSLRFADAPPLRVIHGTSRSCWEPIYPNTPVESIKALLSGIEEMTVVAAHTHLPMDRIAGHCHIINPGSVGVPLDGVFGASYALLEGDAQGWQAELRRIPFDYEPLFAEFERLHWVEEFGAVGQLAVEEFRTARPQINPFLVWRKQHHPDAKITRELLEEFQKVDPIDYTVSAYLLKR